ncbi:MAG: outer membrane lipoprotein carrier protein LolA [Kiloniellaceae bacterium]
MSLVRSLVVLALLLLAPGAVAQPSQEQVFAPMTEQLQRSPVLRADFRQERFLKVLGRPLVSRGKLVFAAGDGVLWQVEDPHEVTYLIRPDAVIEWEGEGAPRRVGMSANPAFRLLTDMLLGALAGDSSVLQSAFEAEALPTDAGWRLRLHPKTGDLSVAVAVIEIAGGAFVEKVRVEEAAGDALDFSFSDFVTTPAELTAAEQAYFAQ